MERDPDMPGATAMDVLDYMLRAGEVEEHPRRPGRYRLTTLGIARAEEDRLEVRR